MLLPNIPNGALAILVLGVLILIVVFLFYVRSAIYRARYVKVYNLESTDSLLWLKGTLLAAETEITVGKKTCAEIIVKYGDPKERATACVYKVWQDPSGALNVSSYGAANFREPYEWDGTLKDFKSVMDKINLHDGASANASLPAEIVYFAMNRREGNRKMFDKYMPDS